MWLWAVAALATTLDARYINLDSRQDRHRLITRELLKQNISATRIRARKAKGTTPADGGLACALSHIDALESITQPVGLILEDDIQFIRAFPQAEVQKPTFDWDVLLFAHNGRYNESECVQHRWCRVIDMQTTSLYAFRKEYIPHLLSSWKKSYLGLASGGAYTKFAGDQTWKVLQRIPTHKWYAAVPRVALQRPGFSSIERSFQNYHV